MESLIQAKERALLAQQRSYSQTLSDERKMAEEHLATKLRELAAEKDREMVAMRVSLQVVVVVGGSNGEGQSFHLC